MVQNLLVRNYQQTLRRFACPGRIQGSPRPAPARSYTSFPENARRHGPSRSRDPKKISCAALDDLLGERPEIVTSFRRRRRSGRHAAAHEELSRRCRLVMVEPNLLRTCLEKPKMYRSPRAPRAGTGEQLGLRGL